MVYTGAIISHTEEQATNLAVTGDMSNTIQSVGTFLFLLGVIFLGGVRFWKY